MQYQFPPPVRSELAGLTDRAGGNISRHWDRLIDALAHQNYPDAAKSAETIRDVANSVSIVIRAKMAVYPGKPYEVVDTNVAKGTKGNP